MGTVIPFPDARVEADKANITTAQMVATMDLLLAYMVHHRGLEWAVEIFNNAVTRQIESLTP